jgi:hypothetical protein
VDAAFYFDRLYPLQDFVLRRITDLGTGLYLTGGTALSRAWLGHRFSDDLELFVNDDERFALWTDRVIDMLGQLPGGHVQVQRRDPRFARLLLVNADLALKIDMVNDVRGRVGTPSLHPVLGLLDTAENILANKVMAALDREEPKDLADIWGLCTVQGLSIQEALAGAQGNAAGLFAADVARVLLSVTPDDWKTVRWIEPPHVDAFIAALARLGEDLLLLR